MSADAERRDFENRYLRRLASAMRQGIPSNRYEAVLDDLGLQSKTSHTWIYLIFRVSDRPGCLFGIASTVWRNGPLWTPPEFGAELFDVRIMEHLDADGWGLPVRCEPGRVAWMHPYGLPPWERPSTGDEPERQLYEQQFMNHARALLASDLPPKVALDGLVLREHCGRTYALLTFTVPERPHCTFADWTQVWIGWLSPLAAEERAQLFHEGLVKRLDHLPKECAADALTWGYEEPTWFHESRERPDGRATEVRRS